MDRLAYVILALTGRTPRPMLKGRTMETATTYAEQFANDWLLVAENDYNLYSALMETADEHTTVSSLSDSLREDWEFLASQVVELVNENISPQAGLFIAQMLQGQGVYPFDLIARRVLEMKEEAK